MYKSFLNEIDNIIMPPIYKSKSRGGNELFLKIQYLKKYSDYIILKNRKFIFKYFLTF